jgi:hypothetical protein
MSHFPKPIKPVDDNPVEMLRWYYEYARWSWHTLAATDMNTPADRPVAERARWSRTISGNVRALSPLRKVFMAVCVLGIPYFINAGIAVISVDLKDGASSIVYFAIAGALSMLFFWTWEVLLELGVLNRILALVLLGVLTIVVFRKSVTWAVNTSERAAIESEVKDAHDGVQDTVNHKMFQQLGRQQPTTTLPTDNCPPTAPRKIQTEVLDFPFVIPGVWVNSNTWDFIVNHRGSSPSYNVEILFLDRVKLEQVTKGKTALTSEEIESYQKIIRYDEIDPKGRGSIFARQFLWTPPNPDHEHYSINITWRDGTIFEDLRIERLGDKWFWAMQLTDRETNKVLVNCNDKGFPNGNPQVKACFPEMTLPGT